MHGINQTHSSHTNKLAVCMHEWVWSTRSHACMNEINQTHSSCKQGCLYAWDESGWSHACKQGCLHAWVDPTHQPDSFIIHPTQPSLHALMIWLNQTHAIVQTALVASHGMQARAHVHVQTALDCMRGINQTHSSYKQPGLCECWLGSTRLMHRIPNSPGYDDASGIPCNQAHSSYDEWALVDPMHGINQGSFMYKQPWYDCMHGIKPGLFLSIQWALACIPWHASQGSMYIILVETALYACMHGINQTHAIQTALVCMHGIMSLVHHTNSPSLHAWDQPDSGLFVRSWVWNIPTHAIQGMFVWCMSASHACNPGLVCTMHESGLSPEGCLYDDMSLVDPTHASQGCMYDQWDWFIPCKQASPVCTMNESGWSHASKPRLFVRWMSQVHPMHTN